MNFYSFLSIIAFTIYIIIGYYVLNLDKKDKLNICFFILCLSFAVYSFAFSFFLSGETYNYCKFWYIVSSIGWITFPVILAQYCVILTKSSFFKVIVRFIYILLPLFFYFSLRMRLFAGSFEFKHGTVYAVIDRSNPVFYAFILYVLISILISFLVVIRWKTSSINTIERKQAGYIVFYGVIILVLNLSLNILFPYFRIQIIPEIGHIASLFFIFGIWHLIKSYKLMSLKTDALHTGTITGVIDFLMIIDTEGRIRDCNQRSLDTLGVQSVDRLSGMNFNSLVIKTGNSSISFSQLEVSLKDKDQISNIEIKMRGFKARSILINATISRIRLDNKTVIGYIITGNDLSWKINLEEEIRQRRIIEEYLEDNFLFLEKLINTIPNPVYYKNISGIYIGCNKAYEVVTGLKREEIVGKSVYELYHPELADSNQEMDNRLINGEVGDVQIYESKFRSKNGVIRDVIFNKTIYYNADNSAGGIVGVIIDITDRKKIEEELKFARDIAEDARKNAEIANLSKSAFLANMSHEIRTPMSGVIGVTELLEQTSLNEQQIEFVRLIKKSGESLMMIINEILDLSKIESGKISIESEVFELRQICYEAYDILKTSVDRDNVDYRINFMDGADLTVRGDQTRLRQIIINILSNAIKFTEVGYVNITVEPVNVETDNKKALIRFTVTDSGIGIPEHKIDKVFDIFYQVDNSTTKKYRGTGLGLSIVKTLVELLKGNIDITSEEGSGTIVVIELPFEISDRVEKRDDQNIVRSKLYNSDYSILIAEDDEINQMLISELLKKKGFKYKIVVDGKIAYELIRKGEKFDLILMDGQMPVMDGFEATKLIKELLKKKNENIIIIALSAYAMQGDRDRFIASGANDFLSKPFTKHSFYNIIDKYLK